MPCPPGPGQPDEWSEVTTPWIVVHVNEDWYGEDQRRAYASATLNEETAPGNTWARRIMWAIQAEIMRRFPERVGTGAIFSHKANAD